MNTSSCCSQPATGVQSITDLLLFGPKLLASSLQAAAQLIEQSSELLVKSLPAVALPGSAGCCDLPETGCPPRCVCKLHVEARPGDSRTATVLVTNRSAHAHKFSFSAHPFQTASGAVPVTVAPANAQLAPGASVLLAVKFTTTSALQPGQNYSTEVLIRGAYEQCVCLAVEVQCEKSAHCDVEQGDPPKRIRAHQWYDHFQCEEPCFPETRATSTSGRTKPASIP